jgi:DNA-binding CsgD family transcriptional regulator
MNDNSFFKIEKLSIVENEVVSNILAGFSTSDTAKILGVKANTKSAIKKRIFVKMEVKSVIELYKILNK